MKRQRRAGREQAPVEQTRLSWQRLLILACKNFTKDSAVAGVVPGADENLWTVEGLRELDSPGATFA